MTLDFQTAQTRVKGPWEPPVDLEMQLVGAWHVGATWDELERLASVCYGTIKGMMRRRGFNPIRMRFIRGTELEAQVIAAYDAGMPLLEIEKKCGVLKGQINQVLRQAGYTKRRNDGTGRKRSKFTSHRDYLLHAHYGISQIEYDAMLSAQGGVCAICGQLEHRKNRSGSTIDLSVDHDHVTGRVRALLCAKCNHGLGDFGDDIGVMTKAIAYLQSTSCGAEHDV
jgi:hypothetical protein